MSAEILLDESPFGTRALLLRDDRPVRLIYSFALRDEPQFGQLYWARTGKRDPRLGGQVCDLGQGREGLLPVRDKAMPEGRLALMAIRREATGTKRPVLTERPALRLPGATLDPVGGGIRPGPLGEVRPPRLDVPDAPDKPGRVDLAPAAATLVAELAEKDLRAVLCSSGTLTATITPHLPPQISAERHDDLASRFREAEDMALERRVALRDGGALVIDEAEALTAVDVDLGAGAGQSRRGAGDSLRERVLDQLSEALSIRAIGGQVALDMPRFAVRQPKMLRDQLTSALRGAGLVSIPAVTKEGLVILILGRTRRSTFENLTESARENAVRPARVLRPDVAAWRAYDDVIAELTRSSARPPALQLPAKVTEIWQMGCASEAIRERFGVKPVLQGA